MTNDNTSRKIKAIEKAQKAQIRFWNFNNITNLNT